jgi:hypothetical protein
METITNIGGCLPGSAWDTWRKAGIDWRARTWATTPGAIMLAASAFASGADGENERQAKNRAFIEGVRMAGHKP